MIPQDDTIPKAKSKFKTFVQFNYENSLAYSTYTDLFRPQPIFCIYNREKKAFWQPFWMIPKSHFFFSFSSLWSHINFDFHSLFVTCLLEFLPLFVKARRFWKTTMSLDLQSLSEAASGAVGALVSTTILYPLDTCKAKYQAELRSHGQRRYRFGLFVLIFIFR